jgi:hypothetical protein
MVHLLVSEGRNTDPVRFFRSRVRVYVGEDYAYGFWVDEDVLFSFLDIDQKKEYLTKKKGIPLELTIERRLVQRLVETDHTIKGKREILRFLSKVD